MKKIPLLVLFLMIALIAACGGGGTSAAETDTESTTEALTPVTVSMWMQPGTVSVPPNGPLFRMVQDSAHPGNLTGVSWLKSTADSGTYTPTTKTSVFSIKAIEWSLMSLDVNNCLATGSHLKVQITYDSSSAATAKPTIGSPVFTLCAGIGTAFGANCG